MTVESVRARLIARAMSRGFAVDQATERLDEVVAAHSTVDNLASALAYWSFSSVETAEATARRLLAAVGERPRP